MEGQASSLGQMPLLASFMEKSANIDLVFSHIKEKSEMKGELRAVWGFATMSAFHTEEQQI